MQTTKQFTTEPPTEPGWYWWTRYQGDGGLAIVRVDYGNIKPPEGYSGLCYWSIGTRFSDLVENAGGEWLRADPPGEEA